MRRARLTRRHFAALLAVTLAACNDVAGAGRDTRLVFGIPSTESSVQLAAAWTPLLDALEAELGLEVAPFFATDYAGVIEAMRTGHVDLAWFGNKAAIEAVDRAGGEVFAQMLDGDRNPGYWSVVVTRAGGRVATIEQLLASPEDYAIGLGDPNSTSGYVVPMAELFGPRGLDPKRAFGKALQGNHESNALAVALGHIDAAPVDSKVLRRVADSHPEAYAKLRELWRSSLIPSDTLCWRKALPEDTRTRLAAWFTSFGRDEAERAVLARLDLAGFRRSSDAQLLPVRRLELEKERLRAASDPSLEGSARAAKLSDLERRVRELEREIAASEAARAREFDAAGK